MQFLAARAVWTAPQSESASALGQARADIGLFTALGNISVPIDAERITTSGFSRLGQGAAHYRRVPAPAPVEQAEGIGFWLARDASGAWWKLDEEVPSSDMFGTVGDATFNIATGVASGTPVAAAIQKMIHFVRYFGRSGRCRISAGKHLVEDWIHLTYGDSALGRLHIEGAGSNYRGDLEGGTTLVCTHRHKPPFVIQGGRGVSIEGITFVGPLASYIFRNGLGDPYAVSRSIDHTNLGAWIDPAVLSSNPGVNHRYSALGAIVIDPFAGEKPSPSYPTVHYPAFRPPVAQYGKTPSAFVRVTNCGFVGFVAAMIVSPSNNHAQGDTVTLEKSLIEFCPYGLSVGNSQCRNINFSDNTLTHVHTVVTNKAHGGQNGKLHGRYDNVEVWGATIQLIDAHPAVGGPMEFSNFYGEGLHRIGNWGAGTGGYHNPIAFRNCEFSFSWYVPERRPVAGVPATVFAKAARTMATFDNCAFHDFGEVMVLEGSPATYAFRNGCRVGDTEPGNAVGRYKRSDQHVTSNFLCNVMFSPSSAGRNHPSDFSVVSARTDVDTGISAIGGELRPNETVTRRGTNGCAWTRYFVPDAVQNARMTVEPQLWTASTLSAADRTQFHAASLVGDMLTVTAPSFMASAAATRLFYGIYPGCVLFFETGSYVFLIERVAEAVVTARLVNGLAGSGRSSRVVGDGRSRGVAPTALNLTGGNVYIGNAAVYTPAHPTLGDFSAGSTTVANAGRADGFGGHLEAEFRPNDLLLIDQFTDPVHSPSLGAVAARANGNPGSLTLAVPATTDARRRLIPLVVRGDIPNRR